MTNRKLKRGTIYALYGLGICFLFGVFYLIDGFTYITYNNDDNDFIYVDRTIIDNALPVVSTPASINRPYTDESVALSKDYYDVAATVEEQKKSIIFYEGTYMQNSSILYTSENPFDVVAILDGQVTSVTEDTILGNVIQITHSNNIISVYQSVNEVVVKEGDTITSGQLLAKSGSCKLTKDSSNNLYFELIINGQNVDPENYYNKLLSEI